MKTVHVAVVVLALRLIDKPSREAFMTIRSEYFHRVNRRLNESGIDLPQNW